MARERCADIGQPTREEPWQVPAPLTTPAPVETPVPVPEKVPG